MKCIYVDNMDRMYNDKIYYFVWKKPYLLLSLITGPFYLQKEIVWELPPNV